MGVIALAGSYRKLKTKDMKVLVTTLGRSHFVQVADSLRCAGVDADLAQGWVPQNVANSFLLRAVSRVLGRKTDSVIYGFQHRKTPTLEGHNFSDFLSEAVQTLLILFFSRVIKSRRLWHWGMKVGFWMHGRHVSKIIKRREYQILHVRSGFGRFAIATAKRDGVKVLVDHSAGAPQFIIEDVEGRVWNRESYWWTVMQDCEDADLLMVDCDFVKSTFLKYGYPADKIRVVYMGLDQRFNGLKKWDSRELIDVGHSVGNPIRLIFTGIFASHKGSNEILEAVSILLRSGLSFSFTVLGTVSLTDEQRQRHHDAVSKIDFRGHLPQDKMCEIMTKQHVYVFPSYSEGCAKSAYEAMSMGLCVVCTKETGLPLKDGYDGFLVEKRSSISIANKIQWLCKHPNEISRVGVQATITMKKYTWEAYAQNVKKIYDELLGMNA